MKLVDLERPNIIVLMLDTFRADYLKDYGGDGSLKILEGLSKRSIVYKRAIAPATYTVPSHLSLFLGKRVTEIKGWQKWHKAKISEKLPRYIERGALTLARKLEYMDYKTALFSSNPFVAVGTGIGDGFSYEKNSLMEEKPADRRNSFGMLNIIVNSKAVQDTFASLVSLSGLLPEGLSRKLFVGLEKTLEERLNRETGYVDLDMGSRFINGSVKGYLSAHDKIRSNFIFINYMEAHDAYPTGLITKEHVVQDRWLYMSGFMDADETKHGVEAIKKACRKRLLYLDAQIGKLLGILGDRGLLNNALVVITSDHGQAFMEHGQMYHDLFPYNEMVNVPLVIARFVNGRQINDRKVVEETVSLTTLHEMILQAAYGKPHAFAEAARNDYVMSDHIGTVSWWGSEIVKRLKDKHAHFRELSKLMRLYDTYATAVYYGNYKLIHYYGKRGDELYDLPKDPSELHNLVMKNRELYRQMLRMIKSR